jgi:hypothetical protein
MPDALTVNKGRGFVEIRSYGTVSQSDIAASIAKVSEIAAAEGITSVLVDTTEQESLPSTLDIHSLFAQFPRVLRVALISTKQPTADDVHFIETVAVNRGISIRVFPNRDDAEMWLRV